LRKRQQFVKEKEKKKKKKKRGDLVGRKKRDIGETES